MSEQYFLQSPYRTGVTRKKRDNSDALSFLFIMLLLRTELKKSPTHFVSYNKLSCAIRVTIPAVFLSYASSSSYYDAPQNSYRFLR
jgi:hypothetical protein